MVSAEYCNGRIVVSVEWRSRYNDGGAWTFLSVHRNKVETLSGIKRNSACYPTQVIYLLQTWPSIYRDQEVPIVVNSVRPDQTINKS